MKRTVPLLIASAAGFVMIVAFFIPMAQDWGTELTSWFNIVAAMAFIIGGGNLVRLNLQKISARRPGWGYAAVTLIAFSLTLFVGIGKVGVHPAAEFANWSWSGAYDQAGGIFWWLVQYVFTPLSSTTFALLAFFIASAAFRAFRAKNAEATLLLGTAFIVLLGRTYVGIVLTDWLPGPVQFLRLDRLAETLNDWFTLTGMRAITIGIALGIVSTSLKILLGVDRSYIGSD